MGSRRSHRTRAVRCGCCHTSAPAASLPVSRYHGPCVTTPPSNRPSFESPNPPTQQVAPPSCSHYTRPLQERDILDRVRESSAWLLGNQQAPSPLVARPVLRKSLREHLLDAGLLRFAFGLSRSLQRGVSCTALRVSTGGPAHGTARGQSAQAHRQLLSRLARQSSLDSGAQSGIMARLQLCTLATNDHI